MPFRVLILGGTAEGRILSERLASDSRYDALISFAGRTERLVRPKEKHRIGGFGGAEGLAAFLSSSRFQALVDATHAFAERISESAAVAARMTGTPLTRIERAPWSMVPGDRWTIVANIDEAAAAIGDAPRRVFLTIGRTSIDAFAIAPQHRYWIRTVDPIDPPPSLPHAEVITARGPFALADEMALLERNRIEIIVSKNSGTPATYAKIEAARALGIPVVMVQRPMLPEVTQVGDVEGVLRWLEKLRTVVDSDGARLA
ncbi:MAG: cobalt-precorrin-6A reductase [Polyangiaceae bacterium]